MSKSPFHTPNSPPALPEPVYNTIPPPLHPTNSHPMVARAKNNIHKMNLVATLNHSSNLEPNTVTQALKDPKWRQPMSEEFDALVRKSSVTQITQMGKGRRGFSFLPSTAVRISKAIRENDVAGKISQHGFYILK